MKEKKEKKQAKPASAQGQDGTQAAGRKSHAGIYAVLMVVVGIAAIVAGLYFYRLTWGTRLLFTRASVGRISKYWMIFDAVGIVLILAGALVLKFRKKQPEAEQGMAEQAPYAVPVVDQAVPAAQDMPEKAAEAGSDAPQGVPGTEQNTAEKVPDAGSDAPQGVPAAEQNTAEKAAEAGSDAPQGVPGTEQNMPEKAAEAVPDVSAAPAAEQNAAEKAQDAGSKVSAGAGAPDKNETANIRETGKTDKPSMFGKLKGEKICSKCGTSNSAKSKFCMGCGNPLTDL